jgi:hypothetical protein
MSTTAIKVLRPLKKAFEKIIQNLGLYYLPCGIDVRIRKTLYGTPSSSNPGVSNSNWSEGHILDKNAPRAAVCMKKAFAFRNLQEKPSK